MSSIDTTTPTPPAEPRHGHSPWLWVSIALVVACVGLLVWGIHKNNELDDANTAHSQSTAAMTNAYRDVNETLGQTNEQLDQANSQVSQAQSSADQAQEDADAAQRKAESASDAQARSQAEADAAQRQIAAAQSRADVVRSCASAYASAIGTLLDGDDVSAQLDRVKSELKAISADCRSALSGG